MKKSIKLIFLLAITLLSFGCGDKKVLEPTTLPPRLGEDYQGGIVVYIEAGGKHGLIMADNDAGYCKWSPTSSFTGANSTAIYSGANNTSLIVSMYGNGTYAASLADQYTEDGYNDWYLPSKEELNQIYKTYVSDYISGLTVDYYWSSTEASTSQAYSQYVIPYGTVNIYSKSTSRYVRAVRKF